MSGEETVREKENRRLREWRLRNRKHYLRYCRRKRLEYSADPEKRRRTNERLRLWRSRPENRERTRERERLRYATDEEFREGRKEKAMERRRLRREAIERKDGKRS